MKSWLGNRDGVDEIVKGLPGIELSLAPREMHPLPLEQRRRNQIMYPLTVLFSSQSNSMEQNRYWEADSFSANPEILRRFIVHCRVYKSPPLVPIPGQITPVYDIQPHLFKINFDSIISSTSRSFSSGVLPSYFSTKILCAFFFSSLRLMSSPHLILLHVVTLMMYDEQHKSWSSSLCSFLHSPVTCSQLRPKYLPQHPMLQLFSLCSFLNVRDQVAHPYITNVNVTLYVFVQSQLL